ncbi:MAG: hypothetical protein EZS28_006612 [Streblomastix strix]|uniref:Uncharacterized protein n=1 Tax=Streblomastix strix TaxID=222440 RepID=A0A5J4WRV7_9EUKA|nr:MAG: hypothetical protein EZS28_006612 [Streblomastix strix]
MESKQSTPELVIQQSITPSFIVHQPLNYQGPSKSVTPNLILHKAILTEQQPIKSITPNLILHKPLTIQQEKVKPLQPKPLLSPQKYSLCYRELTNRRE